MNCREFRSKHVGFVDDVLPAAEMAAMRRHIGLCDRCSTLDVRIRRSLLVVRNLPQIEPSADFYFRLSARLAHAPAPSVTEHPSSVVATLAVVTAALAAAVYFAMAVGVRDKAPPTAPPTQAVVARVEQKPSPINSPELMPAVPAGIPVWPAMFMVGELPMHLANAELLENGIAR